MFKWHHKHRTFPILLHHIALTCNGELDSYVPPLQNLLTEPKPHYCNSRRMVCLPWHNQDIWGELSAAEREVNGFSTVLGPLIMISRRQAAPSRYQHIISGLVQPLNHTRHRNPLVSVTFSPTQEARSQSAIWMLWPFSFQPPPPSTKNLLFFHPTRPFQTLAYHYLFCICCILCISISVWGTNLPVNHLTVLSASFLRKNIFPPRASKMCDTQGNLAAGEVTLFPVSCLERVKFWCDNQTAFIHLEIDGTWQKKNCMDGDSHLIILFPFACFRNKIYINRPVPASVYKCIHYSV